MKRIAKVLAMLVCAGMLIVSCNNASAPATGGGSSSSGAVPSVPNASLDLQIKKTVDGQRTETALSSRAAMGRSAARAASSTSDMAAVKNVDKSAALDAKWNLEIGNAADVADVKIYDYTQGSDGNGGICIEGFVGYLQGNYVDGNGRLSNYFRDLAAEKDGLNYPFVEPGKETKLWLQGYAKKSDDSVNFVQGLVTFTPKHGYGVPDDLPDLSSYMSYDYCGNATVHNVKLTPNDYEVGYYWSFYNDKDRNPWAASIGLEPDTTSATYDRVTGINGNPVPRNYTTNYEDALRAVKELVDDDDQSRAFQINCLKDIFSNGNTVYAWVRVTFAYKLGNQYDEIMATPQFDFPPMEDKGKLYKAIHFTDIEPVDIDMQPKIDGKDTELPEVGTDFDRTDTSKITEITTVTLGEWKKIDKNNTATNLNDADVKAKIKFYDYIDGEKSNDNTNGGICIKGFNWLQGKVYDNGKELDSFKSPEKDAKDGVYFPFVAPGKDITIFLQGGVDGESDYIYQGNVTLKSSHGYGRFNVVELDKNITYDASGTVKLNRIRLPANKYKVGYAWYFYDDEAKASAPQNSTDYLWKSMATVDKEITANGTYATYTSNYKEDLDVAKKNIEDNESWAYKFIDVFNHNTVYAWLEVTFSYSIPGYEESFAPPHFYTMNTPIEDTAQLHIAVLNPGFKKKR